MFAYRARDALAGIAILGLVVGMVLLFHHLSAQPMKPLEMVEGRIVGFHGHLRRPTMKNMVFGNVRLPDNRLVTIRWPEDGRASHCRKGNIVRLSRRGNFFAVAGRGCSLPEG